MHIEFVLPVDLAVGKHGVVPVNLHPLGAQRRQRRHEIGKRVANLCASSVEIGFLVDQPAVEAVVGRDTNELSGGRERAVGITLDESQCLFGFATPGFRCKENGTNDLDAILMGSLHPSARRDIDVGISRTAKPVQNVHVSPLSENVVVEPVFGSRLTVEAVNTIRGDQYSRPVRSAAFAG